MPQWRNDVRRVVLIACLLGLAACAPASQGAGPGVQPAVSAVAAEGPSGVGTAKNYWLLRWFLLLTVPFI